MKKALSLESLKDIDQGKIAVALEHELSKIGRDLNDRPGDKSIRTLSMQVAFVPVMDDSGVCYQANVEFTVQSKLPPKRSRPYQMEVRPSGAMLFNPETPEDVNQTTIEDHVSTVE